MRAFVIYVPIPESEQCATRCVTSASKFGMKVELFRGITPQDYPIQMAEELGVPLNKFQEKYSRYENCVAAFLSHRRLWEFSVQNNEEVLPRLTQVRLTSTSATNYSILLRSIILGQSLFVSHSRPFKMRMVVKQNMDMEKVTDCYDYFDWLRL
jgi:hypothetical protein